MNHAKVLLLVGVVLVALTMIWRTSPKAPNKVETGFGQIEADLQVALKRLGEIPAEKRRAESSLVANVMTLADALSDVGDERQKRVATAAKQEVGRIIFGDESLARGVASGSAGGTREIVPFPGSLPELPYAPLPLQSYVGTYSGALAGQPVNFIVTITNRSLLGVRIVGLDDQPVMEFAEMRPHEFFRPDSKAAIVFTDATERGFRTLYFQQYGMREKAENILFQSSPSK